MEGNGGKQIAVQIVKQAVEAQKGGNYDVASELATDAVIDAFNLGKR
jgi:hypothetical protein